MAKNEVTLTFAGDSAQLEKAFDNVGSAAKDMDGKVDSASRNVGDGFDRVGAAADDVDTRAMGFRDTLTGIQDTGLGFKQVMEGDIVGGLFTLGMGIGDLASGVANFGVQFAKTATTFITTQAKMVATHMINAARMAVGWLIAMGPIILVVAAVVALAVLIAKNWDAIWAKTKEIWDKVSGWVSKTWSSVKSKTIEKLTEVVAWVRRKWNSIVDFVRGLPGKISSAASGMWDGIKTAFKNALNWVIDRWNGLSWTLPSVDTPFGKIGGWTISTPNIPRLHSGGIVPGAPGSETLALLQAGERVTPAGRSGEAAVIQIHSGGSRLDDLLVEVLRRSIRTQGGDVQVVLGSA
jgi:phage-related protein